ADALRCITRAIDLAPDVPAYLESRATYITSAGPARWDDPQGFEESARRALADIERAMELCTDEDDELELYRERADLRADLGDLEGAIADQTHIIDAAPDLVDGWVERASLRKRAGDMAGAIADAARVKELEDETIAELLPHHPEMAKMKRFNLDEA